MIINVSYDEKKESNNKYLRNVDIIDVPERIVQDIENLQQSFFKWLFNKSNDHKYWVLDNNGEKIYCSYCVDAFIEWLNKYIINNMEEKANCVQINVKKALNNRPIIYF